MLTFSPLPRLAGLHIYVNIDIKAAIMIHICCMAKRKPTEEDLARRQAIGQRLRLLRGGMSQRKAAGRIGISSTHLARIESGKTNVSVDMLEDIATAFGVPLNYVRAADHYHADDEQLRLIREMFELVTSAYWARMAQPDRDKVTYMVSVVLKDVEARYGDASNRVGGSEPLPGDDTGGGDMGGGAEYPGGGDARTLGGGADR